MNDSRNKDPVSVPVNSKKRRLIIICSVILALLVIWYIGKTCAGLRGTKEDGADIMYDTADTVSDDDLCSVSESDLKPEDIDYFKDGGVVPVDGSRMKLEDVQLLNLFDDGEEVLTGKARRDGSGDLHITLNGYEVEGCYVPERYVFEDGRVVWNKRIYISEGVAFATIDISPGYGSENCRISVTYPDGSVKTSADGIFTFPYEDTYKWDISDPQSGIYTITATADKLEYFYVQINGFRK